MIRKILCFSLFCLAAVVIYAQDETPTAVTVNNRSGDLPFSASIGTDVEHVDVSSGNLIVNIPIANVPSRGLPYSFGLHYDARWLVEANRGGPTNTTEIWNVENRNYLLTNGFGWTPTMPSLTYISQTVHGVTNGSPCALSQKPSLERVYKTQNFIYTDEGGAKHPLGLYKEDGTACVPGYVINNHAAPDLTGAGIWADSGPNGTAEPTIFLPNGTKVNPAGCNLSFLDGYLCFYGLVSDVHSNATMNFPGGTDSIGRVNVSQTSNANQIVYTVHDAAGNPQTYTVNYAPFQIATAFNVVGFVGPITEYSGTRYGITSIVRPDGASYTFQYDNYGGITQLILPTGAVINYVWATNVAGTGTYRYVSQRTVTVNGVSTTWNFTPGVTEGYASMTVSDPTPSHNQTVYLTNVGTIVSARIYSGPATGTPLRRYDITYQVNDTSSDPILPSSVTTTLENGLMTKKEFDYDSFQFPWSQCPDPNDCPVTGVVQTTLGDTHGNVVAMREYAWKQSADPWVLLRTTTNQYLNDATYNPSTAAQYSALNIVNKIIRQTLTDNLSNSTASDTQYEYDNLTASGPFRGDATRVKRWRNTDASWLATSYTYDTFGNILSMTDPGLHLTQWDYSDLWASSVGGNCVPAAGSHAYVSQVTNAKNQLTKITRYPCTGQIRAHQNQNDLTNGLAGTISTYDLLDRPLTVTDVLGGQTTFGYPDPRTVTEVKQVTSVITDTTTAVHDGLGRPVQSQHVTPAGLVLVDTAYDELGRVASVSNPYLSGSNHGTDPTYGVTLTQYDVLGRVVQVAKQDGSISSVSYTANSTTATDEAGKSRRSLTDALGRLIEVDEPNPGAGAVAASGVLTIADPLLSHTTSGSAAVAAHAAISIWSGDGSGADMHMADPNEPCPPPGTHCIQIYDSGWVRATINGITSQVNYGRLDTQTSVATNLTNAINASGANIYVTASLSGTNINLLAKTAGISGNSITLSSTSASNDPSDFGGGSFGGTPSGGTFIGGVDAVNPVTTWDQGTVTVTIGSFTASAPYGQGSNATAAQVATALTSTGATGLNRAGSPVNASPSGANITINYATPGTAGNGVAVSASPHSTQTQWTFSPASFQTTGITLGNGINGGDLNNNPYVTLYQYNALGNLLRVDQKGSAPNDSTQWRTRLFTYDTLGRLLTAQNPESGVINYTYDADGEVLMKTSPAPNAPSGSAATQTVSYCYEELHRPTKRDYQPHTYTPGSCPITAPVVSYTYDAGTNAVGHLTSLIDQPGTASFGYDQLGRLAGETRVISGISKSMGYTYNVDSSLKSLTYPSNATVTYTPDSAGRPFQAVGSDGTNYVTNANYGPDGSITGFINGSTITNKFLYTPRLQPCRMAAATNGALPALCSDSTHGNVLDLGYDFHAGNGTAGTGTNNGNVYGISNYKDSTRSQSFTYDALNRLTSAQNTGTNCGATVIGGKTEYWGNNYVYDAWGNLLQKIMTKCNPEYLLASSLSNNQLLGYGYDAAGNMATDPTDGDALLYDQENRISTATRNGVTTSFTYDADGNRVIKANSSSSTVYWYMTPGIIGESDLSAVMKSEYVFFGGERVARRDLVAPTGVSYYFSDHLKTASVITDAAGNIKSESDYYPWGGELAFVANDSNHYKFTGKERDSESGLDYFGARYYSNGLGRFISADWSGTPAPVPYADFADPQSLNLYTYVRNLPTTKVDTDGHCPPCLEEEILEVVAAHPVETAAVAQASSAAFEAGATVVTRSLLRIVVVPAIVIAYLVHPGDGSVDGKNENARIENDWQKNGRHNEEPAPSSEPQPSTSGAGARKGGPPVLHSNNLNTTKPAEGYTLRDKDTGEVLKYGETTQGTARYSKADLDKNNARMQFEVKGTKREMHKWQHDMIIQYKATHNGARPRLNKNDY